MIFKYIKNKIKEAGEKLEENSFNNRFSPELDLDDKSRLDSLDVSLEEELTDAFMNIIEKTIDQEKIGFIAYKGRSEIAFYYEEGTKKFNVREIIIEDSINEFQLEIDRYLGL